MSKEYEEYNNVPPMQDWEPIEPSYMPSAQDIEDQSRELFEAYSTAPSIKPSISLNKFKMKAKVGIMRPTEVIDYDGLSEEILDLTKISLYNGIYIYNEDGQAKTIYDKVEDVIKGIVPKYVPQISPALNQIVARAVIDRIPEIKPRLDNDTIYYANGDFKVSTGTFIPNPSPSFNHRRLKWDFKTKTEIRANKKLLDASKELSDFLMLISSNDKSMFEQILQMIGATLLPTAVHRKAFFLQGSGGNGKSTLLELIEKIHGESKTSRIKLKDLSSSTFACFQLVNKTINIIDDLDNVAIKETGTFKEMVAGESMSAEIKFGKTFTFKNEASLIAGGNNVPYLSDKGASTAILDRMMILEFRHKFLKTPEGNREREALVGSFEVINVLASLAAYAAHKSSKDGIKMSVRSKESLAEFAIDTDPVLYWMENDSLFTEYYDFIDTKTPFQITVQLMYKMYSDFCDNINKKPVSMNNFAKSVLRNVEGMKKERKMVAGKRAFYFIYDPVIMSATDREKSEEEKELDEMIPVE